MYMLLDYEDLIALLLVVASVSNEEFRLKNPNMSEWGAEGITSPAPLAETLYM